MNDFSQAERDRIGMYLNFDTVASPNHMFMLYDGDQSSFTAPVGVPIPEGSIQIEDVFESVFTNRDVPYDDTAFSGRSDYQAFILAGIPAGGLFTGAQTPKTAEQEEIWGGLAGQQLDPCYHLACDTIANVNMASRDRRASTEDIAAWEGAAVAGILRTRDLLPCGSTPSLPRVTRNPRGAIFVVWIPRRRRSW